MSHISHFAWHRHSYCTRFLYTVVPAELYWKDDTLDKLNEAFAADLSDLYKGLAAARCLIHDSIDLLY